MTKETFESNKIPLKVTSVNLEVMQVEYLAQVPGATRSEYIRWLMNNKDPEYKKFKKGKKA